jgi:hypothetical protein
MWSGHGSQPFALDERTQLQGRTLWLFLAAFPFTDEVGRDSQRAGKRGLTHSGTL